MNTDSAAAASRAVYDGQARRMMLVEFASRFVNWLIRPATGRPGPHDLFDANFRRMAVISRHAATDVALGDNADQLEAFCILNHRRAAAA